MNAYAEYLIFSIQRGRTAHIPDYNPMNIVTTSYNGMVATEISRTIELLWLLKSHGCTFAIRPDLYDVRRPLRGTVMRIICNMERIPPGTIHEVDDALYKNFVDLLIGVRSSQLPFFIDSPQ